MEIDERRHVIEVNTPTGVIRSADIKPLVTHFGDIWRASIEDQVVETFPGGNIGDLFVSSPNNWRKGILVAHAEIMDQLKGR